MTSKQASLAVRVKATNTFRKRHPEVSRAWTKVQRAVKAGLLIRAERCERCAAEGPTEASHDDYSKPLDVEWLCRPCHVKKDLPTHCKHGHQYTKENTYRCPNGWRVCRECRRQNQRRPKS